jgi:membrane-associated phospholipid phosphatase
MESLSRAIAVVMVLSFASSARADDPTWEMDPWIEVPIATAELSIAFAWVLASDLEPPYCAPVCDRADVNVVDRFSAGWFDRGWSLAGDIGVALAFVGAAATLWIDEGLLPMLSDAVVVAEAVGGALMLANLTNMATRRPRPHVYGTESPLEDRMRGRAAFSLFSGHAAGAYAAAISTFLTLRERDGDSAGAYLSLALGLTVATFVCFTRVVSGQHFFLDTLIGAVVGTAVGFVVPLVHESHVRVSAGATDEGGTLSVSGEL